ncbi:MAG TPA: AMP-binding protein, partial [Elusimicrobiota bacterium]|nr:AMP-binding protein [Elusimicrobiota bacterium]
MTLTELLRKSAAERSRMTALIFRDRRLSYEELQRLVDQWAAVLYARGLRPGQAYGIVARNSPEFVITLFAVARLGARAAPVNFLLKPDEIAFIFQDAGVRGVLTQSPFLAAVRKAAQQAP